MSSCAYERAEVRALHRIERALGHAGLALEVMVGTQGRAQRPARVARGGLDPQALEAAVAEHLAVGHAVQGHAPGQAEVGQARLRGDGARQPQHDLVGHRLDGGGDVHVALGQELVRPAGRTAEELVEAGVGHAEPGAVVEVAEVEAEGAVGLEIDEPVEDEAGRTSARRRGRAP